MSFLFQNLRFISSRIHDAEETEGLLKGIAQLVGGIRRDIEGIEEIQKIHFLACAHFPFAPDTNNYMFVSVLFEAAVTARGYLKISEMKSG